MNQIDTNQSESTRREELLSKIDAAQLDFNNLYVHNAIDGILDVLQSMVLYLNDKAFEECEACKTGGNH